MATHRWRFQIKRQQSSGALSLFNGEGLGCEFFTLVRPRCIAGLAKTLCHIDTSVLSLIILKFNLNFKGR